jgi:hypothetical protein
MPRVFECGMLPDRRPWIASELIEGRTVAHLLDERDASIHHVIAVVRDIADILAEAHRRGLVHGHVAPDSIVIPAHPRRFPLCLVDWVGARTHDSNTPLPLVVGSRYAAPEQASGTALDDRADIYALGRIGRDLLDSTARVSPLLVALLDSMIADDRAARPSAAQVRSTAAWLAGELGPEAVPEPTADTGSQRSSPITSEIAAAVAGEIG